LPFMVIDVTSRVAGAYMAARTSGLMYIDRVSVTCIVMDMALPL